MDKVEFPCITWKEQVEMREVIRVDNQESLQVIASAANLDVRVLA